MEVSSSKSAFCKFSNVLKFLAKSKAVFFPTLGIPRAYIKDDKSQFLLFSIAFNKF